MWYIVLICFQIIIFVEYERVDFWQPQYLMQSLTAFIFSLAASPFSPTIDPINLDGPVTVNGATDNIDAKQIQQQLETISIDQQGKEWMDRRINGWIEESMDG